MADDLGRPLSLGSPFEDTMLLLDLGSSGFITPLRFRFLPFCTRGYSEISFEGLGEFRGGKVSPSSLKTVRTRSGIVWFDMRKKLEEIVQVVFFQSDYCLRQSRFCDQNPSIDSYRRSNPNIYLLKKCRFIAS